MTHPEQSAIYRPLGVKKLSKERGGRVSSSYASTQWSLLNASFPRGATTHVSGILIALTRGERLKRQRDSLRKPVRPALVFVWLFLTHFAAAWLCSGLDVVRDGCAARCL